MMRPSRSGVSKQGASRKMGDASNDLRGVIMNSVLRGVMLGSRVPAKAFAKLCICVSVTVVVPAMASTTVTTYTYDAGNHVNTVTDPRGLITAYNYDGLGQQWGVSSPDTGTTTYSYDAYGRRSSMTRANNVTTSYGYDTINRPTSVSAGGQTQTFTYDNCTNGLGRPCSVTDAAGSTTYIYTPEGWIAGRGFSIAGTTYSLGFGYDTMGNVSVVTYPDGYQAIYSSANGVVSGITFAIGSTQVAVASNVTWQPWNAALSSWTSNNGLTNTLTYDADGRLTSISVSGVESLGFGYDEANRLNSIANALNGTTTQHFEFDDKSRLVTMESSNGVASYGYDADGNRITTTENGAADSTTYSSTSNQLTSTTGTDPQTYGYDKLGNITTLGSTTAYQYDPFNRMNAASGMSYYVNPEGQRLQKSGSAGTTYFAPNRSGTLMAEYNNGTWIDYVWLNGKLIGREVNGQLEAIGDDQVGRPQVVTNASQTVVWSAQNLPFTRSVTASSTVPLNIGFPGQYFDAETGLWNNGFRDYDPTLGRYVESDPMGLSGGTNTYAYANGDPLSLTDPLGLCPPSQKCLGALKTAGATAEALQNANENWNAIQSAAADYQIDPALLAAVGVRETGFRNIAQIGGGFGAGVYQVDLGANSFVTSAQAFNLNYSSNFAAAMLSRNMTTLAAKHPNLNQTQLLQATAASYNFGTGNISGNPNTIDMGTTHNNYGQNVLDLMSCFDY